MPSEVEAAASRFSLRSNGSLDFAREIGKEDWPLHSHTDLHRNARIARTALPNEA